MDEIDGEKDEMDKIGSGRVDQFKEVQEYNRMYKELDDLYHEIALGIGGGWRALCFVCNEPAWGRLSAEGYLPGGLRQQADH